MSIFLLFLAFFFILVIYFLLNGFNYNLIMFGITKIFFRNKTMDIKPQNNHQIRVLTLEDGHFQEETIYQLKKG